MPFLNTVLLIFTSIRVRLAVRYLKKKYFEACERAILLTVYGGIVFLTGQFYEYLEAGFRMREGVLGASLYMLTGLHGMHVLVGMGLLFSFYVRIVKGWLVKNESTLELFSLYWHLVDVV